MAKFTLYVDTVGNKLVQGPANASDAEFPVLYQGDTPTFHIYLLDRTTTYPHRQPFTVIDISALSLKVALGPKNGTAGSTLYTQQFTWAKDTVNNYFYATLPLNTAAITTLLGSSEFASAWFEVEITQDGLPTTVCQKSVTIHAEVIETGSITVPAGATAMTAEDANNTFLKQVFDVATIRGQNGVLYSLYIDANGQLQVSPIAA